MEKQLSLEGSINEQVQKEFSEAVKKAKEFHPVTKLYIDGYTGEYNRYKTPDNYYPDEGVVNSKPDLCHTEDHVSIAQMYARLKQMHALSIQDSEFDYDESDVSADDLDEDTISDLVSEVDDPSDYGNYINDVIDERFNSGGVADNKNGDEDATKGKETLKDVESDRGSDDVGGATEDA